MMITKNNYDYEDLPFPETARIADNEQRIKLMKGKIDKLRHDIFYLWVFLSIEGMAAEAGDYLEEHLDDFVPGME